ncbi:GtrA family protein [Actinoplanes sp. NPDC023801]|uniref:GtrA family protein n=1 Tax=Actinoplanes sp. NPDC023801 TaxID=3154595 RepID=UPI0033F1465B
MRSAETRPALARYAVSGGLSALTHFTVGLAAVRFGLAAVPASTTGFAASIAVSYLLQRAWVFRSGAAHTVTAPRFLTVTAAAFGLNTAVLWTGTDVLGVPYPVAQVVAIVLIPGLNYVLNSRWTFA